MKWKTAVFALLLALTTIAVAGQQATLDDGRKVLLKDDGRWEFLNADEGKADQEAAAVLSVQRVVSIPQGCRIGLELENKLNILIRSLVLRFTAFKSGTVAYDSMSRGFSFIKPTDDQYREILFRNVSCEEIVQVLVHDADNCSIGDLDKFSDKQDQCLSLVKVVDSDLIKIYK